MKFSSWALLVATAVFSNQAISAQIFIKNKGTGIAQVALEGEIESGDSAKLLATIKENPVDLIVTRGMVVNSPGGSVTEAIKIAKIIEASGMTLRVEHQDTCASACFILFASASYRWASDDASILIHRPYFVSPPTTSAEYSRSIELQQKGMNEMREFLQARSVSSSIIDKMMTYPSNEAYKVTVEDVYKRIGPMSPTLEELTLRNCGLSNSNIFRRSNDGSADIKCIDSVLIDIKNDYIKNLIGVEKYRAASRKAYEILTN